MGAGLMGSMAAAGGRSGKTLTLRTAVQPFKSSAEWETALVSRDLPPSETALLICDMWDRHWCASATRRCDALARRMAPVVEAARARGIQIIHAPSDCMEFYKDTPQRKRMKEAPTATPPTALEIPEPPLPIDDSDGGCDDQPQERSFRAWKRQHPAIRVADADGVTDNGAEVYNLLRARGIRNLVVMGVHTNMCVLHRSFAIKQMTRWGIRCVLARDLTDTMYNPRMRPFVAHDEGTKLVVQHIERYWCPTIESDQLLKAWR
ncbi:MAG: isochorismatase [Actinomycetota bacterium]